MVPNRLATVFDVESLGISLGPRPRAKPVRQHEPVYIPVGDRLFALSAKSFEVLHQTPLGERQCWSQSWRTLPAPPFPRAWNSRVTAYAVHPAGGGRTIFFSVVSSATISTFTVGTAEKESPDGSGAAVDAAVHQPRALRPRPERLGRARHIPEQ